MPCHAEITLHPPDVGGYCPEPGTYACQVSGCPNYCCDEHVTICDECKMSLCIDHAEPEDHDCHGADSA